MFCSEGAGHGGMIIYTKSLVFFSRMMKLIQIESHSDTLCSFINCYVVTLLPLSVNLPRTEAAESPC